jgi:predicted ABC-type ATPase
MAKRELILVGGPNGAGKTTFALEDVARRGGFYLGADAIAAELSPENPALAAIVAGRKFLERFDQLIQTEQRLVVESTLAGKSLAHRIQEAKQTGFTIKMIFVFVDSADENVNRVRQRVKKGGHDVPEEDIRRRFGRSFHNFWHLYRALADEWHVIYNQLERPDVIAVGSQSDITVLSIDPYIQFRLLVDRKIP